MRECMRSLIDYGIQLMANVTGAPPPVRLLLPGPGGENEPDWSAYERAMAGDTLRTRESALTCVFSLVHAEGTKPVRHVLVAGPLSGDGDAVMPVPETAVPQVLLGSLWKAFESDVKSVLDGLPASGSVPVSTAEGFYHVLQRHAWAIPCTYGEPGVSLFEQWKAVAAMAVATGPDWRRGPADKFSLIGGDIPGIQSFVSTITSKGAAKGLRGRSYFLQLLGDAVVRRLLTDLDLCWPNVVYSAGGNFVLLVPARTESERLDEISLKINDVLLGHFRGDLFLALAMETVSLTDLGPAVADKPGSGWVASEGALKRKVAAAKRQPFADRASNDRDSIFTPEGEGGNASCVICHRELAPGESIPMGDGGEDARCQDCDGFQKLAESLARPHIRLGVGGAAGGGSAWQQVLQEVSLVGYTLDADPAGAELVYAFSPGEFRPGRDHGFRWLANATPRRQSVSADQEQVATLEQMVESLGFKRLAILRMDMDNLGGILVKGIPERSMALTSALSAALDRFFIGRLDRLAAEVASAPGMKDVAANPLAFYVIYAGGDDMFAVCSWPHAPLLAQRIRAEFSRYCGRTDLGISSGISLQGVRAPIYRGADLAKDALDEAKALHRKGRDKEQKKDGVAFLDSVLTWQELDETRRISELLYGLVKGPEGKKSILGMLGAVYEQWKSDRPKGWKPDDGFVYGPWVWKQAYAIARAGGQQTGALEALQREALLHPDGKMHLLGLAVRWVDYLAR
jgi:CRISPR-associated protein Csm1